MIKKGDRVFSKCKNMTGQVVRIRGDVVYIAFITDEKIKKNKNDIYYVDGQWRFDDWTNLL